MGKVLVACEYSGVVRSAFRSLGHDAWSCDLLPSEDNSQFHYEMNIVGLLGPRHEYVDQWDLIIAHPPCTNLSVSGARWFKDKRKEQYESLKFFEYILTIPTQRLCVENPVSIASTYFRKPDQTVQPWSFGVYETKATCLWLKGLQPIVPQYKTKEECRIALGIKEGTKPTARIHLMSPGPNRGKERSRTYECIANAMAEQWGKLL